MDWAERFSGLSLDWIWRYKGGLVYVLGGLFGLGSNKNIGSGWVCMKFHKDSKCNYPEF